MGDSSAHEAMRIDWTPVAYFGPIPLNWYGIGWVVSFFVGTWLVRRWARATLISTDDVDGMSLWILFGALAGARLYFIAQNQPGLYAVDPWRILAVWEGGLAFFGGLFGAIGAAFIYLRRHRLPWGQTADLFAPAVPIAAAIGRIPCFLAGMDYGTRTQLPWGVIYTNPNSYAPQDGTARHPVQLYELVGDLVIAAVLVRFRGRLGHGRLFLSYLLLFGFLRFLLFFARGDVPVIAGELKNGHWTALALMAVTVAIWLIVRQRSSKAADPSTL